MIAVAVMLMLSAAAWPNLTAMVTSLTFSRTDVAVATTVSAQVTIDSVPRGGGPTTISLTSSRPAVLAVPSSVSTTLASPLVASFNAQARGAGCATVTARAGQSPSRAAMVFVNPVPTPAGSPIQLTLGTRSIQGGTKAAATIRVTSVLTANFLVQTTSDNTAAVPVPASVTVPRGGVLEWAIPTNAVTAPTCALITVTFGSSTSAALLRVVP